MSDPLIEYMQENDVSVEDLFYMEDVKKVWEKVNDTSDSQISMSTIFKFQGLYYQVDWALGLTETQENEYAEFPFEILFFEKGENNE